MSGALNILNGAAGQSPPNLFLSSVCANTAATPAPASLTDPLYVVVPQQPTYHWTFADWPAEHGNSLPAAGSQVLIARLLTSTGYAQVIVRWTAITTVNVFQPLTFATGYSNFDAGGPTGHAQGEYLLDSSGFVHVRGLVQKTTPWVAGETIATLPAGFRPASNENRLARANDGTAGHFIAAVSISPAGLLVLGQAWYPLIASPGTLTQLTLGEITFQQAL